MGWWKAVSYLGYGREVLRAIKEHHGEWENLAVALSKILFKAVNQYTKGLAEEVVDYKKLTSAVRQVVGVFVDVLDGKGESGERPAGVNSLG